MAAEFLIQSPPPTKRSRTAAAVDNFFIKNTETNTYFNSSPQVVNFPKQLSIPPMPIKISGSKAQFRSIPSINTISLTKKMKNKNQCSPMYLIRRSGQQWHGIVQQWQMEQSSWRASRKVRCIRKVGQLTKPPHKKRDELSLSVSLSHAHTKNKNLKSDRVWVHHFNTKHVSNSEMETWSLNYLYHWHLMPDHSFGQLLNITNPQITRRRTKNYL